MDRIDRRRFLVSSLGLSLLGFSLQGCGSAGRTIALPGGASGGTAGAGLQTASGRVQLPSGSTLTVSQLRVDNAVGSNAISAAGQFSLSVPTGIPSLAFLRTTAGRGVLFGFVDPTVSGSVLDATATAVALIYFALDGYEVDSNQKASLLALIKADPATATLATVVAQRIAANPYALEDGDAQIAAALKAAYGAIGGSVATESKAATASMATRDVTVPPQVLVQPSGQQSGVEVVQDSASVGVIATNHFRRHCEVLIYETGTTDNAGTHTDYPTAKAVGHPVDLTSTNSAGVVSTITSLRSGETAYIPVSTPTLPLANESGAAKTFFDVIVLGASASSDEPAFFSESHYASFVDQWRKTRAALNAESFIGNLAFGVIVEIWGLKSAVPSDVAIQGAINAIVAIADPRAQAMIKNIEQGQLVAALPVLLQLASGTDSVSAEFRSIFINLLASVDAAAAKAVADAYAKSALSLAVKMVLAALNVAGLILGAGDIAAVVHDLSTANEADRWNVTLFQPTLQLNPLTASIPQGGAVTFNAKAPAGLSGTILYDWSTTAAIAVLSDGNGQTGRSFESSSTTVTLQTTTSDQGTINVSVTAILVAADGTRNTIGSAQAAVTLTPQQLVVVPGTFIVNTKVDYVNDSNSVEADIQWPVVPNAIGYHIDATGFNDPAYWGTSVSITVTPSTYGVANGIVTWGLSGGTGPGTDTSDTVAYYTKRFQGLTAKITAIFAGGGGPYVILS